MTVSTVKACASSPFAQPQPSAAPAKVTMGASTNPYLQPLASVRPENTKWLWPDWIPLGKPTILDGDPGLGKSLLTLDIAARVTSGKPMPDGSIGDVDGPAGVVLLSAEDDLADTIRPRLEAMGGDIDRVMTIPITVNEKRMTIGERWLIEEAIRSVNAKLVIVDPLMAYMPEDTNSNSDQQVRASLAPLFEMAAKTGVAIVFIRHLNKKADLAAKYRGGGSIAFLAGVRSSLVVAADPFDGSGQRRVLAPVKCNLTVPPKAMAYHVETAWLEEDGVQTAKVEWEGTSDHTADSLMAAPIGEEELSKAAIAEEFLREFVTGPVPQDVVVKHAQALDISHGTLQRAKRKLGIVDKRIGFGANGYSMWYPPKDAQPKEVK